MVYHRDKYELFYVPEGDELVLFRLSFWIVTAETQHGHLDSISTAKKYLGKEGYLLDSWYE